MVVLNYKTKNEYIIYVFTIRAVSKVTCRIDDYYLTSSASRVMIEIIFG